VATVTESTAQTFVTIAFKSIDEDTHRCLTCDDHVGTWDREAHAFDHGGTPDEWPSISNFAQSTYRIQEFEAAMKREKE
jgi:hypothetical protein